MDVKLADTGLLKSRYRLTKQRVAVLRVLGDGGHLSAEIILRRARLELPSVSLGTIYRTLEILRDLGLVQMFSYEGVAARYEASMEKHHHLLCSTCGLLLNVQAEGVRAIAQRIARAGRFAEVSETLTIVGRCPDCVAPAAGASPGESEPTQHSA